MVSVSVNAEKVIGDCGISVCFRVLEVLKLVSKRHLPKLNPKVAPTVRAEHHNTKDVHFVVTPRFDGRDGRNCLKAGRVPEIRMEATGVDLQSEFSVPHSKKKYKRIRHERYCSKYQKRHGVDPVD